MPVANIDAIFVRKGTNGPMAQVMGQHARNVEVAIRLERAEIEKATAPDSPGGAMVTNAELVSIMDHRSFRMALERTAESTAFANSVAKNGLDAPTVVRFGKQYFSPEYDDAA
jgi:hypothetical protein